MNARLAAALVVVASASLSAMPPELQASWRRFQGAFQRGDVEGVAELTRFPLRSPLRGGDVRDGRQLRRAFVRLAPPAMRQTIARKTPVWEARSKRYVIDFSEEGLPIAFGFQGVKGRLLWTYIEDYH